MAKSVSAWAVALATLTATSGGAGYLSTVVYAKATANAKVCAAEVKEQAGTVQWQASFDACTVKRFRQIFFLK